MKEERLPQQKPREAWATVGDDHRTDFAKAKSPLPLRLGAWAAWIGGLALLLCGVRFAFWDAGPEFLRALPALTIVLAAIADLVLVLLAQKLWKRSRGLIQAKGTSTVPVVMASLAFAPMILFFAMAKNVPTKAKLLATMAAVAGIALCVAAALL